MIVICAPTKLRKQERISKLNKICHIDNVGLEKKKLQKIHIWIMKRMSNYLLLFHFSCLDNIDDNEEGDDKYVCTIYMLRIYFSKTGRR